MKWNNDHSKNSPSYFYMEGSTRSIGRYQCITIVVDVFYIREHPLLP